MTKLPADLSGQDLIKALKRVALRYRGSVAATSFFVVNRRLPG
jgi:hypothetical protein